MIRRRCHDGKDVILNSFKDLSQYRPHQSNDDSGFNLRGGDWVFDSGSDRWTFAMKATDREWLRYGVNHIYIFSPAQGQYVKLVLNFQDDF